MARKHLTPNMGTSTKLRASGLAGLGIPLTLAPMEARLVDELPKDGGWQFEPKWDGFRCLAFRAGGEVEIKAKSGKSLTRFFPEVIAKLSALKARNFVLDGELIIPNRDGEPIFDALQMRLHPAESRIKKLSEETPADIMIFDCLLAQRGKPLLDEKFVHRRQILETFFAKLHDPIGVQLTPCTHELRQARSWLNARRASLDGVIAKKLDLAYRPGERAMWKVKCRRTADCVVGGFRYERGRRLVGSLLLGLYDTDGFLHHIGFTSAIGDEERPALTRRLERLIAPPGFTGDAPGGPSRWSTERLAQWEPLRPELVVEVRYDQVTGRRFRHGTRFMRWRPDKAPQQCTLQQLD